MLEVKCKYNSGVGTLILTCILTLTCVFHTLSRDKKGLCYKSSKAELLLKDAK